MNTGRITNEPDDVYFGDADKPKFGSSAIKQWILDPELFYHQYVKKDVPMPDFGQIGAIGHAVDEKLLENRDRTLRTEYVGSTGKAFKQLVADNPDKHVLTTADAEQVDACVNAGLDDDHLPLLVKEGQAQVVYRTDFGPFYLQAKIDLETPVGDLPQRTCDELFINPIHHLKLLTDTKTTATLLGRNAFKNNLCKSPFHYPIQDAFYRLVVATVEGTTDDLYAFRFCALAKDGTGCKWYDVIDVEDLARSAVLSAIGELKHRYQTGDWTDFETGCEQVLVPDNYLKWRG